jgi:N-acylneuraminate cytidylyltransferase
MSAMGAKKHHPIDIVVTSDSSTICDYVKDNFRYSTQVIHRPSNLAEDTTPLVPVLYHALESTKSRHEAIITLQPTSPLRNALDIKNAIDQFEKEKSDSLVSVCEDLHVVYAQDNNEVVTLVPRTQCRQLEKPVYICNGAIFISKEYLIKSRFQRTGGKISLFVMPEVQHCDIHTKEDLELAEFYLKRRKD